MPTPLGTMVMMVTNSLVGTTNEQAEQASCWPMGPRVGMETTAGGTHSPVHTRRRGSRSLLPSLPFVLDCRCLAQFKSLHSSGACLTPKASVFGSLFQRVEVSIPCSALQICLQGVYVPLEGSLSGDDVHALAVHI